MRLLWGLAHGLSLLGFGGGARERESREYAEWMAGNARRLAEVAKGKMAEGVSVSTYSDVHEAMLKNATQWDEIARKARW